MKHKAYLLIVAKPETKLAESELREIRRLIGDNVCPFAAWERGAVIGFSTTESAAAICEKIRAAVGDVTRISVLELGLDQGQWGAPHHHQWLQKLRWLAQGGEKDMR